MMLECVYIQVSLAELCFLVPGVPSLQGAVYGVQFLEPVLQYHNDVQVQQSNKGYYNSIDNYLPVQHFIICLLETEEMQREIPFE